MRLLNKKAMAGLFAAAVAVTLIALPSIGSDSEHQDLRLVDLEVKILNDNVAVNRAELAYELALDEQDEADDNKGSSGSSIIETRKRLKYYPKEADMNVYVAEQDLNDVKQSEILKGTKMYYEYLLLIKEIGIKNDKILRLQDELAGVEKKIELGTATVNARTTKTLEIADAEYELMLLQDEKDSLFLDLNLALQQDLKTVLVIEDVEIPYEEPREVDIASDLEYVLVTNQGLYALEKQDALDAILLDIYEDNNSRDAYDSNILKLKSTLKQNELEIADKKLNLEYELRSKLNSMLNAYDTVAIRVLELENLQMTLNTVTKRYEVGFETENTVKAAEEAVAAGELALLQAKLDYFVASETYENFIN